MISVKLKILNSPQNLLSDYYRQYNNLKRWAYNRFGEGLSVTEVYHRSKELNNLEKLDMSFKEMAIFEAKEIFDKRESGIIFGGKKDFWGLKFGKIDKSEFDRNKSFRCTGRKGFKGNRKFDFLLNKNKVEFKPERGIKIPIEFSEPSKNQRKILDKAQFLADNKEIPICVTVTKTHIIFTINESIVCEQKASKVKDRILSIDSNPNFIAYVIKDFGKNKIIHREVFDLRKLNTDEISTQKRHHEIFHIAQKIARSAKHYNCEAVGIEKLNIESKDNKKGKTFNKLVNNFWNRNKFFNNLKKWLNIYGISFLEILPQYSSCIGQLTNPEETDSVAAAIEIGRRAYLFNRIFIRKDMEQQNIVYPNLADCIDSLPTHWKEMVTGSNWKTWRPLLKAVKKSKSSYRFHFDDWIKSKNRRCFRSQSIKSLVDVYSSV